MKTKKEYNIYIYLLLKVLLAFGLLLLLNLFFYLCNTRVIHVDGTGEWLNIAWGNVIFGAATVGTFLLPYLLLMLLPTERRWKRSYHIVAETFYIVAVLLIIICRGANSAYYQYTYRLLSNEIFSYLGISGQMGSLVPHFAVDYWYAWVFPVAFGIVFFYLNSRIHLAKRSGKHHPGKDIVGMTIGLALVWLMMRGGFGHFLRLSDAAHYCQPKNTVLVNNDAYNILRTCFSPDLQPTTSDPSDHLFSPVQRFEADKANGRNVVLLIVESLGQEFMGCYNQQPEADTRTPFLDSLAQYCTLYDGRSNGKKSIEGIVAITTAIPNLMDIPFSNSKYASDDFEGIPTVLKRHGYHCAFFHGSYNGEMNFDSLCFRIGFDEYLGKTEYENENPGHSSDYDGCWGIFDEPFLQFALRHMNGCPEPFLAEVFTVTSHHPFPIPEEHLGRFKEGRHPILKCVEYTDYSLRRFFEEAQKQPWYNNTLFIITGDHSGHGLSREYNDYDGWYRIPMMVYDPQNPVGSRSHRIVQHTDLFPTLVDWLGFDDSVVAFGNSVLQQPQRGWQVYYGNGFHCMVSNNADNPEQHDITLIEGDHEEGTPENLRFLKAIIQQYNYRIINNKLKSL